jgi:Domain of unknown function (DUF4333)
MSTPPTGEDPYGRPPGEPAHGQPSGPAGYGPPGYGPPGYGPPGYGPPGYGQQPQPGFGQPGAPPAAPPDRKRKRLIRALELVGLAIAVGVATLVYVLSATILDRAAVESAVATQFEEREGVALDLECDERMIVEPGADYECEGTTADGEEVQIVITVTDENGAYTWAED